MDSISLKMPVTVKAKLTEKLKARLLKELEENLNRVVLDLQQLNIQEQRVLKENEAAGPQAAQAIHAHFDEERQKREQFRAETTKRKEDLEKLAIGAEIVQGTLERQVEVHVGDNMRELMNVEVLVEDDKIVAIRG
ncbi:YlqD family protein [uncultured Selenomonas sp.]|uniref:YlqD family protein n=1 Tax=uncultured Selenomonas sp. TaxID=159275 RepID=UPI0025D565E1|nr:YlqD family protein [uncultured Selenomonas sp.]